MEKLRTGRDAFACISATTVEESTPPDRKAPSGTSATMRRRTASLSKDSSASVASVSSIAVRPASPAWTTSSSDQ
jgi:hypothetical protein